MPIYEYVCKKCGAEQEKIHGMKEVNTEPCEHCDAPPEDLEKLLSVFAKHLSWSTWNVG